MALDQPRTDPKRFRCASANSAAALILAALAGLFPAAFSRLALALALFVRHFFIPILVYSALNLIRQQAKLVGNVVAIEGIHALTAFFLHLDDALLGEDLQVP